MKHSRLVALMERH